MLSRKKLIVVGDGACGKTCLLIAFCRDEFFPEYQLTVFETYVTEVEVDSLKVSRAKKTTYSSYE